MPSQTRQIALLRAVNVGDTGKLPMERLRAICLDIGFGAPQTYIQSGNVVFDSDLDEAGIVAALQAALAREMSVAPGVLVRDGAAMAEVLARNPFVEAPTNRAIVHFYPTALDAAALVAWPTPGGERLHAAWLGGQVLALNTFDTKVLSANT